MKNFIHKNPGDSLLKLTFSVFFMFAFMLLFTSNVWAANGVTTTIDLKDLDGNGGIETIDLLIDNDDGHTWEVNGTPYGNTLTVSIDIDGPGNGDASEAISSVTSVAINGSATADPVTVRITLDPNDLAYIPTTNGTLPTGLSYEVIYAQGTGDQTCTNCIKDGTDNELNNIAEGDTDTTDTEEDVAAPVINGIFYNDNGDGDGQIDTFLFEFSEELAGTSSLAANNFTFADVGDFTSAAFGADATNLLGVGGELQTSVTLGTESSVVDTNDGSGSLSINLIGTFNLDDSNGNSNTSTVTPMTITPIDQAYGVITAGYYSDSNNDGVIDRVGLTFSEPVTLDTYDGGDWEFTTAGDVGLSGDFGVSDCSGSGTANILCTDADNSDLSATANRTGLQSGGGDEPVLGYTNAFAFRFYGTNDFFEIQDFSQTLSDAAQPVLISSTPAHEATDQAITVEPVLTFSEQIVTGTFAITTTNDPTGGYTEVWSSNDTVLTLTTSNSYSNSTTPTFDITTATAANGTNTSFAGAISAAADPFEFTTIAASSSSGSAVGLQKSQTIVGEVSINNGDALTESHDVTLNIKSDAQNTHMVISNDENFVGASWQPVKESVTWELESGLGEKTVYIRFQGSGYLSTVRTDKIEVVQTTTNPEEDKTDEDDNNTEEVVEENTDEKNDEEVVITPKVGLSFGDLIRTESQSQVYYYGKDGKRHGFASKLIFDSYYKDFSKVKTVSDDDIASIPLGSNVKVRPGTWLIKITSDPKVYAVGQNGMLHWVQTEEIAEKLYGVNWNKKIIDISVAFFGDYQIGEPITQAQHADGTLIRYENDLNTRYVIDGGKKREIVGTQVFEGSNFQDTFVHTITSEVGYEFGPKYEAIEDKFADLEI